jgi:hypothetical protein
MYVDNFVVFNISDFDKNYKAENYIYVIPPRGHGLVVAYPPATKKTGTMRRLIESRQGIG